MKKIIAIAAALSAAASLQLPAEKANYFDFVFSAPIQFVSETADFGTLRTDIISVGVGINSRRMYTAVMGLYMAANAVVPQKLLFKSEPKDGGSDAYSKIRSDYSNLFGFDILIGPAIVPISAKRIALSLNPGLRLELLSEQQQGNSDSAALTVSGGLAADILVQFRLTRFFNISAGVMAAYDFLMFRNGSKLDGRKATVAPKIAAGFTL